MGDTPEAIKKWASDWADSYDQGWDVDRLSKLVGSTVTVFYPKAEDESIRINVIGYSRDVLVVEGREAYRSCFLTDEGLQVAIKAGVEVDMEEDEEDAGGNTGGS